MVWGRIAAACAAACAISAGAQAGTKIDTQPGWGGSSAVGPLGTDNGSFGQALTAPVDQVLTSFRFYLSDRQGSTTGPITYRAYVYAWNGTAITGPELFSTGARTSDAIADNFELVDIDTGGVTLTTGQQY